MEFIGDSIFPSIDKEIVAKMVEFSNRVCVFFLAVMCLSAVLTKDCWLLESFLSVKCDDTV